MAEKDTLTKAVQAGDKDSPNYRQRRRTNSNDEESDVAEADEKLTNMDLASDVRKRNKAEEAKKKPPIYKTDIEK